MINNNSNHSMTAIFTLVLDNSLATFCHSGIKVLQYLHQSA